MKNVIIRNMERLIACSSDNDRERIEPMTAWKWRKLYQIANHYGILPWISAGVHAYKGDFFMQIPEDVKRVCGIIACNIKQRGGILRWKSRRR